jgi:hypothetical protein
LASTSAARSSASDQIVQGENEDDAAEKSWRQPWIEAKVIDSDDWDIEERT